MSVVQKTSALSNSVQVQMAIVVWIIGRYKLVKMVWKVPSRFVTSVWIRIIVTVVISVVLVSAAWTASICEYSAALHTKNASSAISLIRRNET